MPRTPSLSSLRLFLQVAQSLSFSRTARQANLSQPALSRTIRLLEEELGVRLFDRNSRNVSLTPAGATLLPTVERLTSDFDQAFGELMHSFQGARGRVFAGALPSMAASLLPPAIARLQETYPRIEIVIREEPAEALARSLSERRIDFAISTPPPTDAEFDFQPILADEFVLVCSASQLSNFPDPSPWSAFADHPFIGMEARSSVRAATDAAFAQANVSIRAHCECALLSTAGGCIAAGVGISLMPQSTLPLLAVGGEIAWRPLQPPTLSRQIGICRLAGRTLSPAAANFLDIVTATINDRKS